MLYNVVTSTLPRSVHQSTTVGLNHGSTLQLNTKLNTVNLHYNCNFPSILSLPINTTHRVHASPVAEASETAADPMNARCLAAEPAAACPPPEDSACQGHPPQHLPDCCPPSWE